MKPRCPHPLMVWALILALALPRARAEEPAVRELFVMVVGVGTYMDPAIPGRPSASCDAAALAAAMDSQQGRLFAQVHTLELLDTGVNRDAVLLGIRDHFAAAGPEDEILFYLAGYGLRGRASGSYSFVMANTELAWFDSTTLTQAELYSELLRLPAAGLIVTDVWDIPGGIAIVDAMPRGHEELIPAEPLPMEQLDPERVPASKRWVSVSVGPVRRASGQEAGSCQSIAGSTLVEALSTRAADSIPDALLQEGELVDHLSRQLASRTGGQQLPSRTGQRSAAPGWLYWLPGGQEACNKVDDDSDGQIDEGFDQDQDGFYREERCPAPVPVDCDDTDPDVHPDQPDVDNLMDDDCDQRFDEDVGDTNGNGYSDGYDREMKRRSVQIGVSLAASAALGGLAGLSLYRLDQLHAEVSQDPDQYISDDVGPVLRRSWTAVGGVIGAGIGITFTFPLARTRREFYGQRDRYRIEEGRGVTLPADGGGP